MTQYVVFYLVFLATCFPVAILHELGHILVGWLQGARGPVIRLGHPKSRCWSVLRVGPCEVRLHGLVTLWTTPAGFLFRQNQSPSPAGAALRAAGGPLACALLFAAMGPQAWWPSQPFTRPLQTCLVFWSLANTVIPLIPVTWPHTGASSDGLVIWSVVLQALRRRGER